METGTVEARVASNEHIFRESNERIVDAAEAIALEGGLLPFICECCRRGCVELARLSRSEYGQVRTDSRTFLVVPGHEITHAEGIEVAEVVEKSARFSVMRKVGEAGDVARELDSRRIA